MKTTVSLDDDVAKLLHEEMRRSGHSLNRTVNEYLRLALTSAGTPSSAPFVVTPRNLGLPPGLTYDCAADLLLE